MRGALDIRRSLLIYTVALVCVGVAFVAGLEIGSRFSSGRSDAETSSVASSETAGSRVYQPESGRVVPVEPPTLGGDGLPEEVTPSSASTTRIEVEGGALETYRGDEASRTPAVPTSSGPGEKNAVTGSAGSEPTPSGAPSSRGEVRFTIQVAAHSSEKEAQATLLRLRAQNFVGRIRPPVPGEAGGFYRVWVGEYPSAEAAREMERRLQDAGFPTYVRRID
jgi:cell division septation protein DedD